MARANGTHEAGHAIVAVYHGISFSSVSIAPQPDSDGRVTIRLSGPATRNFVVVLYAGAEAADFILKLDSAFYEAQLTGDLAMIEKYVNKMRSLKAGYTNSS